MDIPREILGEMLSAARRKGFFGRWAEQELFQRVIDPSEAGGESFKVLYVHGPGGIGKSALLRIFAEIAKEAHAVVVRVDGRDTQTDPTPLLQYLAMVRNTPGRTVLLIDAYEVMAGLDGWLREELIPELPGDAVVVLAARKPPAGGWQDDPGWRNLCKVIALGPLSESEATAYLADTAMSLTDRRDVQAFAAGHPLALTLARELAQRGSGAIRHRLTGPGTVSGLVAGLIDAVPGPLHRRALQVCAWARATTEALLREVLGLPDAAELFDWLRSQPYIEAGAQGIFPHDVVREVLVADLRWRDPTAADKLNDSVRRVAVSRARSDNSEESDQGLLDLLFIWRHDPATRPYYDWESFGSVVGESARTADRADVHVIVALHSGGANADLVCYWFDRRPDSFVIYRRDGVVQGLLCKLALHEIDESELQGDPLCAAAWRWSRRHGVERHQPVLLDRCMLDRSAGELSSPGVVLAAREAARHLMTRADLTLDFVVCVDPGFWAPFYARIGFLPVPELTMTFGSQELTTFVHDWRMPEVPDVWRGVPPTRPALSTSSRPDPAFADAVRHALKDLSRPDRLATSTLLSTSLATTGPELREALTAVIESLQSHPRDRKLFRALDRTYLHPAPTQELAAELLGLPFSTYRRHLTDGVKRVVAVLWAVSK